MTKYNTFIDHQSDDDPHAEGGATMPSEQLGREVGEFGELQLTGGSHMMHDAAELVSGTMNEAWSAYRDFFDGWFDATIPRIDNATLWIGETTENIAEDMSAIATAAFGYQKAAIDALVDGDVNRAVAQFDRAANKIMQAAAATGGDSKRIGLREALAYGPFFPSIAALGRAQELRSKGDLYGAKLQILYCCGNFFIDLPAGVFGRKLATVSDTGRHAVRAWGYFGILASSYRAGQNALEAASAGTNIDTESPGLSKRAAQELLSYSLVNHFAERCVRALPV